MSTPSRSLISIPTIIENLQRHYLLWIVPTIACTVLAVCYATVRSNKFQATQKVIVRDEVNDSGQRTQGDYGTPEQLKIIQESVVQTVRQAEVVKAALTDLHAANELPEPSTSDVESAISKIGAGPPKGKEFGKTTHIEISTEGKTASKAEQFNTFLVKHLEQRLQEIRAEKARQSIIDIQQGVTLSQQDLDRATKELETMERQVGRDLGELRTMTEGASGSSNLRESSNHIKQEIRNTRSKHDEYEQLISMLKTARQDPDRLTEAPTRLFELQPALKRMKEGLVDAQIKAANLLGRMTDAHPEVQAARLAEQEVKRELTTELDNLIAGLESDKIVSQNQVKSLENQLNDVDSRLNGLANLRTPYNNLFLNVKSCNDKLAEQQKRLGQARAIEASAFKTSLLIKEGAPEAGSSPVGPGSLTIIGGGMIGGLLLGLGLVFVTVPIGQMWGRRRSDYAAQGRRSADALLQATPAPITNAVTGRRTSDPAPSTRRSSDRLDTNRRASDNEINNGQRISDQIKQTREVNS